MARPLHLTFDCYGTLIDWHGGLQEVLARAGVDPRDLDRVSERYVALEMEAEAGPYEPYREVMARTLERRGITESCV